VILLGYALEELEAEDDAEVDTDEMI